MARRESKPMGDEAVAPRTPARRMAARYLVRFDDLCPTMNWELWERIETLLVERGIAPILAIVPDNQDERLKVGDARPEFWDAVRSWQMRGWTIGLHGYQHLYVTRDAGLLGISDRSEFAGLDEGRQQAKLSRALAVFEREGLIPEVWIAPGHSFDSVTLKLLKGRRITVVSDGFYLFPRVDSHGVVYVPQQLWRFRPIPFGLWTVCHHHNRWTDRDLDRFRADLDRYGPVIISLRNALRLYRPRTIRPPDALFSFVYHFLIRGASRRPTLRVGPTAR